MKLQSLFLSAAAIVPIFFSYPAQAAYETPRDPSGVIITNDDLELFQRYLTHNSAPIIKDIPLCVRHEDNLQSALEMITWCFEHRTNPLSSIVFQLAINADIPRIIEAFKRLGISPHPSPRNLPIISHRAEATSNQNTTEPTQQQAIIED